MTGRVAVFMIVFVGMIALALSMPPPKQDPTPPPPLDGSIEQASP